MPKSAAKSLVLIRHAKAAWPEETPDHQRPLADRGRRDAPAAGRWLRSMGVVPQVAVVSSALRTHETYELVAGQLAHAPELVLTDAAYAASAGELLDLVHGLAPDASVAMVVAHNPGIGTLANILDDGASSVADTARMRSGYPTTSVAIFEFDGAWSDLAPGAARLTAFTVARG